jgi:hypothetical protein
MQQHRLPADDAPAQAGAWYRQPVLWLGAAIFAASLAGCVWTIVLGARHADVPVQAVQPYTLLDMPMHGERNGKTQNAEAARDAAPRKADLSGRTP